MPTRFARQTFVLMSVVLLTCCAPGWPTGPEIEQTLQQQDQEATRSAEGRWRGTSGLLTLDFSLSQEGDGRLHGTGTMKEGTSAAAVPIRVSGTYARPHLSVVFSGLIFEGRQVSGVFEGLYTSSQGISSTLQLTGENYTTGVRLLLQEQQ